MNLAVVFGGRTVEHDVSVITGYQFMENADKSKYNIIPIYIARDGVWYTGEKLRDLDFLKKFNPDDKAISQAFIPPSGQKGIIVNGKGGLFSKKQEFIPIDVVAPAMHGVNGEDGTLQGLLELANIPYTSCNVLSSSAGMDKVLMKAAFKGCGFPVLDSMYILRDAWHTQRDKIISQIEESIPYPIFVKPANLGSSIGINKALDKASLINAIDIAVSYDKRVLIEKGVIDIMEINCSCLGYLDDVKASVCEQPVSWKEFLTFDEKYLRGGKSSKGMHALTRIMPAPISDEMTKSVQQLAIDIFKALDCKGVVRIDFIIDKATDTLYVNEINTIPGSFSFYLWEPAGITFSKLIDCLVDNAFKAQKDKDKCIYAFDSQILNKVGKGTKGKGR